MKPEENSQDYWQFNDAAQFASPSLPLEFISLITSNRTAMPLGWFLYAGKICFTVAFLSIMPRS